MNWVKKQMANTIGTAEPIYGPSAVHTVTQEAASSGVSYIEMTKEDLKWRGLNVTSVETQTFYFMADNGHMGMAQVIYSNVVGIKTTVQFNTKIYYPRPTTKPHLWSSDPLKEVEFSDDRNNFYAKDVAVELNEAGDTYTIKSMSNQQSIVNLTVTRTAPGFKAGKTGTTSYGTDPAKPWGYISHMFWSRAKVTGNIMTREGPIDFTGKASLSFAMQAMKPHHAASKWNFCNFQGEKYSAFLMDFVTPPSYGTTKVSVGGISKDGEIVIAGTTCSATHTAIAKDAQNDWPEPTALKFEWSGTSKDGTQVTAVLEGPVDDRLDKVDVMAEVPGFVKNIVAGAVGTKPYIYQYSPSKTPISLKIKIGDEEISDPGQLFSEATFISA